eukprot:gene2670-34001_t
MDPHCPRRAIIITVLLSLVGGATWAPFASTPQVSKAELNYTDADTSWQENANNIAQATATPFAAFILTRHDGLRSSVLLSAAALLLQCSLFALVVAVPRLPSYVALLASIFGGVNAAFVQGVCSSYIFYNMIEHTASFKGFQWLLYSEAAAAFLLLIATVYTFPGGVHFRGVVPLQDSLSGSDYKDGSKEEAESLNGEKGGRTVWRNSTDVALAPSRLGFGEGLLHCLRQPSVVLIVVAAAAVNGTLNSWQGVIPILFKDLGNATGNANATDGGNGFKSSRGDICSLVSSLGYAVGGYFGGELGDRCFANKLKLLLVICISLGAATFLFIVLLIPPGFMCNPCIPINNSGPDAVYALLLGFSFTSGACLGGTMPISLELLAATAYPAAEGITANASLFLTQLFCFALTALVPIWSAQVVTFAVLATAVACLLLTLIARPSNNRRKAQLKAAAHDTYLN